MKDLEKVEEKKRHRLEGNEEGISPPIYRAKDEVDHF